MEVKIKKISDKKLKKDFEVIVPKELIDSKVNDYIDSVKQNFSLKGFRKGQVPSSVIKEKYGKSIMNDEIDKIINQNVKKIVEDNKIKLAMQPKADLKKMEQGSDVEIVLTLEIFPEVPEIELNKIKLNKKDVEINQEDVDTELGKLAKYFSNLQKQDNSYKAKLQDTVDIDYVGKVDKKEFDGGSAKNYKLELGSKSFIDDFEEQLVGKKAGDETVVKVKFPKNYHNDNLSGQSAEFAVKINEVFKPQIPELTGEFIKEKFGVDDKKILEDNIKKELENQFSDLTKDAFKLELFEFLNKKYDFDLPEGMVEAQTKMLWQNVEEQLKTNPNKFKNEKEKNKAHQEKQEQAIKMIRCGIILSKICEQNKIELTKEDFDQEISKILTRYPGQENKVIEYYQKNPQALENIRGNLIESKAINFILNQENIEKKKINTKDFEKFYKKIQEDLE